jgi:CheY-like chemotaxis protein
VNERPLIMAVDDDAHALERLHDALEIRYGREYVIESPASPSEAVASLERHEETGRPIALVIADQWMVQSVHAYLQELVRAEAEARGASARMAAAS